MSRRQPKNKSAARVTSNLILAMAMDLRNYAAGLDEIALEYMKPEAERRPTADLAALVDAVFDHIRGIGASWPRAKRVVLLRSVNRKVYGQQEIATKFVVVLCSRRDAAMEDIRRLHREARDRRIIYISHESDCRFIQGLGRDTTVWCEHSPPGGEYRRIVQECRARFNQGKRLTLAEAIALLDWSHVEIQGLP